MAEIINLRQARKAKARSTKEAAASANRAAFGRSKVARERAAADDSRRERDLDGHKRER